jgi:hypothetical protein
MIHGHHGHLRFYDALMASLGSGLGTAHSALANAKSAALPDGMC